LPKPPRTALERFKPGENESEQGTLLSDRLAAAITEGKLEDFIKQEIPDNEYARNLAGMMMGMMGMIPPGGHEETERSSSGKQFGSDEPLSLEPDPSNIEVPEDVRKSIEGGDVKELMALLRREYQKRMPDPKPKPADEPTASITMDKPTIDKVTIDRLVEIATDNNVTLDWIILRAIKLYVHDYNKTGRL